ncbi:MAG: hypothetical protein HRU46_21210 [Verrucomicrobiales bacterium]|nr:hypothetical protein [Verrucomicrobiales bacterium]
MPRSRCSTIPQTKLPRRLSEVAVACLWLWCFCNTTLGDTPNRLIPLEDIEVSDTLPSPSAEPRALDHSHSLGLSDEVVPFEEFGADLAPRQATLNEVIDNALFPENLEREGMLRARSLDDVTTEIPERRSIFGTDRFLSPGAIDEGIELKTGAIWRPSFLLFGNFRTALQSYEAADGLRTNEWVNRLDIFGNLYLTSTERFLFGIRPLDEEGVFTGVAGGPGAIDDGFTNGLNFEPTTFFFEGVFDEIFPNLDPDDSRNLDYMFSIGRQPVILQDGIMALDDMDALGVTRHNLFSFGASATRLTGYFGFNELHRGDNIRDSRGRLLALSANLDYPKRTIEADAAYVSGSESLGGDGGYIGLGHLAQFGYWNSNFRVNASFALSSQRARSEAIADGWLLTHQLSRVMKYSDDVLTLSMFGEIDNYTSAARGPATGGPLGGFSVLQRAVGIGTYGPAIEAQKGDQLGFEISYQHFLDSAERRQLLAAVGAAGSYDSAVDDPVTFALSLQYQQSLSENLIWTLGGFGSITEDSEKGFGVRTELNRKF